VTCGVSVARTPASAGVFTLVETMLSTIGS